jgi:hypothetical protein
MFIFVEDKSISIVDEIYPIIFWDLDISWCVSNYNTCEKFC